VNVGFSLKHGQRFHPFIYIHTLVGANFPIQAWLKVSFHWYNILVSVGSSFKLVEDLIHFYTNGCWFFIQASWRFHSLMHAHWWGLVCCFSFIQDFVYKNVTCLIKILDWVMMIFVVPPSVYTLRMHNWFDYKNWSKTTKMLFFHLDWAITLNKSILILPYSIFFLLIKWWLFWLVEWNNKIWVANLFKMKKCDSFFKINLWNNNNKFIHLLTIHSYLPTLLCTYIYIYIHRMCIYFNIYIYWYMLVTKIEPWSKYLNANALFRLAITWLCNIMCQITNITCFPQIILQIKILTCIFFLSFCSNEANENEFLNDFQGSTYIINKHTQIQFIWRNMLFYFVIKQLNKYFFKKNMFSLLDLYLPTHLPTTYILTSYLPI